MCDILMKSSRCLVNWSFVEKAINNPQEILSAFLWDTSKKGYDFWHNYAKGDLNKVGEEEAKQLLSYALRAHNSEKIEFTEKELDELL